MVDSVTSVSNNGLRDWLVQRISSVLLGVYTLFILGYLLTHPHIQFAEWQALFAYPFMRIFSLLVLLSLMFHAWIGIWTILTDYVKPVAIRLVLQVLLVLALFSFLAWGIQILWGI